MDKINPFTRLLVLLLLTIALGCGRNPSEGEFAMMEKSLVSPDMDMSSGAEERTQPVERKLIKEGRVEFQTENIATTRQNIFAAVKTYKGYISSDQEFKAPGRISNTMMVRVPAESFDDFLLAATKDVEHFDSKTINVRDVTEEFLDIEARLKTKKELEVRYRELLNQAKTVTELLEIEKQIGELRSDIESIEGRLKYLQSQVSYSTLTLTFYEEKPNESAFGQKFKKGFRNGWDNLIWFFVFLTNLWPFVLIALVLIFGFRIYRGRNRRNNL